VIVQKKPSFELKSNGRQNKSCNTHLPGILQIFAGIKTGVLTLLWPTKNKLKQKGKNFWGCKALYNPFY
jgi:hypothetical protein